jgi:aminoglycoside 6'-N-acetyltransferase I
LGDEGQKNMDPDFTIYSLDAYASDLIDQTAQLLFQEFSEHGPNAWPTLADALAEVHESLGPGRISRVAMAEGRVLGWIGAIPQYDGHVYELHPLVVHSKHRRKGIGSLLIQDLEMIVRERGGITLWLGSDDEDERTSIGGMDLYPNVLENLASMTNLGSHPFQFYLKNGFSLIGVLPDANGYGKPDIFMAKRVSGPNASRI